jgi:hypothetical protein
VVQRNSVVEEEYDVMEVLGKGAFAVVRRGKRKDTGDAVSSPCALHTAAPRALMTVNHSLANGGSGL